MQKEQQEDSGALNYIFWNDDEEQEMKTDVDM